MTEMTGWVSPKYANNSETIISNDGKAWSYNSHIDNSYHETRGLCFGNGKFVAVGDGERIYNSTDGITWNSVFKGSSEYTDFNDVTYCNGKFVVVGTKNIYYSNDGVNWTKANFDETDTEIGRYRKVKGNAKYYVSLAGSQSISDNDVSVSTDGINWSSLIPIKDNNNQAVYDTINDLILD